MELWRALGALVDPPGSETDRLCAVLGLASPTREDHAAFFTFRMYPYASVYLGEGGQIGGEARDRIAGFWRAMGLLPPAEPDHLGTMLAFHAELSERAAHAVDQRAARILSHAKKAFLYEHLYSWLPLFCLAASPVAPAGYRGWVDILSQALTEAMAAEQPPAELPLALREAAPPRIPADPAALIDILLSPAVSGMVVVREDLAPLASGLGVGMRQGERRFILGELYRVDPGGFIEYWIERLERWSTLVPGAFAGAPAVGDWWRSRGTTVAEMMRQMKPDVASGGAFSY